MKRDDWTVGQHGVRPAGPDDACLYCKQKIGEQHNPDCVIRQRTVVCEIKIQLVRSVPEDADADHIEFSMNESSSCFNNLISQISDQAERWEDDRDDAGRGQCFCNFAQGSYVREATADDEESAILKVDEVPS